MNSVVDDISVIIYLLRKIDEDESIDNETITNENHVLVKAVVFLLDKHLIGDNVNHNIRKVRNAGYNVYAGEMDMFGWLSGCIDMKRGIIVFG